jgi:preprotein translocase subunit SecA
MFLIDQVTGHIHPGKHYDSGLQQAIEAKEGLLVSPYSQTDASIDGWAYLRLYHKLSGLTGTASFDAAAFRLLYGLDVVEIPTHRPVNRIDHDDLFFYSDGARWAALADGCVFLRGALFLAVSVMRRG